MPAALAVGWAIVDELNPVTGLQLYDLFATDDVPIVVDGLMQVINLSEPASAIGAVKSALTVTWSVDVHPLIVFVTVNV